MSRIQNPNIEYAVRAGKLGAATRSLCNWHIFEQTRLRAERRLFNQELQRTTDPSAKAELQQAMSENEIEQRNLDAGWENSSLR